MVETHHAFLETVFSADQKDIIDTEKFSAALVADNMRNVYSVFMASLSLMKRDGDTQKDTSQRVNHSQHRGGKTHVKI